MCEYEQVVRNAPMSEPGAISAVGRTRNSENPASRTVIAAASTGKLSDFVGRTIGAGAATGAGMLVGVVAGAGAATGAATGAVIGAGAAATTGADAAAAPGGSAGEGSCGIVTAAGIATDFVANASAC